MNGAVVWYQSRSVLAAIAAIIIVGMKAFHVLPADLTQDQIVSFLIVAIPIAVSLEGRISATKQVVTTPAKAAAINAAVARPKALSFPDLCREALDLIDHPNLLAPPALADPAKASPVISMEKHMSLISAARKLFGVIAVAVAPTWNKAIANSLAQAEATLVPILGDDAKRLCEDAASTTLGGFQKLASVVSDLAKIAADKGIKADFMVLTVIASKAYAQIVANAPELLDVAIETGITAAAGPAVGALAAPVVESTVAAGASAAGLTPAAT